LLVLFLCAVQYPFAVGEGGASTKA
jgi:hypothetical protein